MTENADATEGLTRALRHDVGKPTFHHIHPLVLARIFNSPNLVYEPMIKWYYYGESAPQTLDYSVFPVLDYGARKYTTYNFKEVHKCVKIIPIKSTTGKVYVVHATNVNIDAIDLLKWQNERKSGQNNTPSLTLRQLVRDGQNDTLTEVTLNELSIKNTTNVFTLNETLVSHLRKRNVSAINLKITREETKKLWRKRIEQEEQGVSCNQTTNLNNAINILKNTGSLLKLGTLCSKLKEKPVRYAEEQTKDGIQTISMEQKLSEVFFVVAAITDLDFLETLSTAIKTFYGTSLNIANLLSQSGTLNYALGMKYSRVFDSWFRHAYYYPRVCGETTDVESGEPHAAHAACNELFALTYEVLGYNGGEFDNRVNLNEK